jgi:outer membrane lipoprotein SlyB
MKKGLITIVCLIALSVTAIPAGAQTRLRRYDQRYDQRVYTGRRYNNGTWYDNRSVWNQHRDKITTAAGAGAGALLGGIIGGGKGALIGALAGGGGAALYTYKLRDRNRYRYGNRRY